MKNEFDIIYVFQPKGETYTMVFFIDADNIFKTNINSSVFLRFRKNNNDDELQAYLRKRYDYHRDSVSKIDKVELKGLYEHFNSIGDEFNSSRVFSVMRNRKIDDVLND